MLSVITHSSGDRPAFLERCKTSVNAGLKPGMIHRVIPGFSSWSQRYLDSQCDEFVAFVDDDDTIHPEALDRCLKAIIATGAGVAFTDEMLVKPDLSVIQASTGLKKYDAVRVLPRAIHHLTVMRSSAIDPRCVDLHEKIGCGIDWFMNASAALVHGAVHVPMYGYYWTIHESSHTAKDAEFFRKNMRLMTNNIEALWGKRRGHIPVWKYDN